MIQITFRHVDDTRRAARSSNPQVVFRRARQWLAQCPEDPGSYETPQAWALAQAAAAPFRKLKTFAGRR